MRYFFTVVVCFSCAILCSQENKNIFSIDANYFYGSVLEHNSDIAHLITEHPSGFILSYNKKTFGLKDWEGRYNYPDWGFSFIHQDMKNEHRLQ
jgi:hypothetical protein